MSELKSELLASGTDNRANSTMGTERPTGYVTLLSCYWPLYVMLFLVGVENFILSPFIPLMAADLGHSTSVLATLTAAYSLSYALTAPFCGNASDRIGRLPLLITGVLLFGVGNLVVSVGGSLACLEIGRALAGLGGAMAGPTTWALLAGCVPELRGRAMGLGMGAFSFGQVVGIPVGGMLAEVSTWRTAFASIGCCALILSVVIYSLLGRHRGRFRTTLEIVPPRISVWDPWRRQSVRSTLLMTALFHAASLAAYTFVGSAFAVRFSLSTQSLALLGVLVGTGSVCGAFVSGIFNDRRPSDAPRLIILCSVAIALFIPITLSSKFPILSLTALALWFFASGAFVTTQQTNLSRFAADMRGSAISWNTSVMHAGAALGVMMMALGSGKGLLPSLVAGSLAICCAILAVWSATTFLRQETLK